MEVQLYDLFEIENCRIERHQGTVQQLVSELKTKCDKMSDFSKEKKVSEWSKIIREHLPIPDRCKNLLETKGVSLDSDLATIFSLAYGDPNCGWLSIHYIKWDDGTLTTNKDLTKMQFGEEGLRLLEELGLLLFSKK